MTLDRELAADVVQEACIRASQRWSRVSGLNDPIVWVRTVAWRLAVSQFRRRAVATRVLRRLETGSSTAELTSNMTSDMSVDGVSALPKKPAPSKRDGLLGAMSAPRFVLSG